jgi:chromosome segregation ATPase
LAQQNDTKRQANQATVEELAAALAAAQAQSDQAQQAEVQAQNQLAATEQAIEAAKTGADNTSKQATMAIRAAEAELARLRGTLSDQKDDVAKEQSTRTRAQERREAAAQDLERSRARIGTTTAEARQKLEQYTARSNAISAQFNGAQQAVVDAQTKASQERAIASSKIDAVKEAEAALRQAKDKLEAMPKSLDELYAAEEKKV